MLMDEGGHFYVCGDCKMAEEVQQKLKEIIKLHANLSEEEVEDFILYLMVNIFFILSYMQFCLIKKIL